MRRIGIIVATLFLILGSAFVLNNPNQVDAATKHYKWEKYQKRFYHVKITKRTQVYKVIRGKYSYLNKYKKAYVLEPGQDAYIQARGLVWSWTIENYDHCSFRHLSDLSWFKPMHYDDFSLNIFSYKYGDNTQWYYRLNEHQTNIMYKLAETTKTNKEFRKKANAYIKAWGIEKRRH